MKVLFVCSGNSQFYKVAPFIKSQGDSLEDEGIDLTYFLVEGKGLWNYLKNAGRLRKFLKQHDYNFDIIHAHYSLCGWVAVLAFPEIPIVLSLMGDDAVGSFKRKGKITLKSRVMKLFVWTIQPFVKAIISKSPNLERVVYRKKISYLIPNGIDLEKFKFHDNGWRDELGLQRNKKYVLFLANPEDRNKNFALARDAVKILNRPDVELINVYNAPHKEVVKYLNAVNVFVLCSFSEGSPNVVKEAMTCGCPLVATNVGDVSWVTGDTPGCYISSYDVNEFSQHINKAIEFSDLYGRTEGRERILELGLDTKKIAHKIISIYNIVSGNQKKVKDYTNSFS